jgi:hypothetical protein
MIADDKILKGTAGAERGGTKDKSSKQNVCILK